MSDSWLGLSFGSTFPAEELAIVRATFLNIQTIFAQSRPFSSPVRLIWQVLKVETFYWKLSVLSRQRITLGLNCLISFSTRVDFSSHNKTVFLKIPLSWVHLVLLFLNSFLFRKIMILSLYVSPL